MRDKRSQRIQELKEKIRDTQSKMVEVIKNKRFSKEDNDIEARGLFNDQIAKLKATLDEAEEELKETKMNKRGSAFFEFTPTPGLNRRQRRQAKKLRRR